MIIAAKKFKDIPSDVSCTSRPQSWHIPRATSICPLPVMGTHYARAETDREEERKRAPVRCKLNDARVPAQRKGLRMHHLLSNQEPGLLMNTIFRNVPLGTCLTYQLQDFGLPNTTFVCNRTRENCIRQYFSTVF